MVPEFINRYKSIVGRYRVGDIEFSGGTYQVQIFGDDGEFWPFLQFDDSIELKDWFCSCEESCPHLAAAYCAVYGDHDTPLHKRFSGSFWDVLCRQYAYMYGYDIDLLHEVSEGQYALKAPRGGHNFLINSDGKGTRRKLADIVNERVSENEGNSLKFSNLSPREITLWREGRPSRELHYELSWWSDFAKWMMVMQHSGVDYSLKFSDNIDRIEVLFPGVSVVFEVVDEDLKALIPVLSSVNSPLMVSESTIEAISYDKKRACFLVEASEGLDGVYDENIRGVRRIGNWMYIPNKGFFSLQCHGLLKEQENCDVARILDEYYSVVADNIVGDVVNGEAVSFLYNIFFDEGRNLHICPYVFVAGDLTAPYSRNFGSWVYLEGRGFYNVDGSQQFFEDTVIDRVDVSSFVCGNRTWLNGCDGYHIHLSSIEDVLSYAVRDCNLHFFSKIEDEENDDESMDFGEWVYVLGKGFYSKVFSGRYLLIRSGLVVGRKDVSDFVDNNSEECRDVAGFFARECPIVKAGLRIELDDAGERIIVTPEYELLKGLSVEDIEIFDDVVFAEGYGFYKMPTGVRLPENFRGRREFIGEAIFLFVEYHLPGLRQYVVDIDPRLEKPIDMALEVVDATYGEEGEWNLQLRYSTDKGTVDTADVMTAIREGRHYIFSNAGLIQLSDSKLHWLRSVPVDDSSGKCFKMSTMEFLKVSAFEAPRQEGHQGLMAGLEPFLSEDEPDISGLGSTLRGYQSDGVKWLWLLYRYNLSGLLCDDMGLGKTHQAMALIASVNNDTNGKGAFLIICPTSVIYHWEDKLHRFLPGMKVYTYHGSKRNLGESCSVYDILLTSYGIYRCDKDLINNRSFDVAIFDEIQVAKNYQSKIHDALRGVRAKMRLGLTGTPIENKLRELKSLFDIVLESYMPGEKKYREMFINPIEKFHDHDKKALLRRIIAPFMLRRTKEAVLPDLPEKTEEIAYCEMLPEQHDMYHSIIEGSRETVIKDLEDDTKPIPYLHIFTLLSQLKQLCDHPAVLLKAPHRYRSYQSGKWELFIEILNEARESRQKVVVFSQFLTMLDIIEEYLQEHDIHYASIRGSTKDRAEQLFRFQDDCECEVFVGSLQAVGLGVDLTAASVVIHYDRWWSAAKENQATDRVHRIGQSRGVQVFKMVTKDTFEERIHELIAGKGKLMEDIVDSGDQVALRRFNREDILSLLHVVSDD